MLANQASSTQPTTAASSDQMMQDGAGRLWTSLGQSPGLQMAWRRLPVFRSDMQRRSSVMSLDPDYTDEDKTRFDGVRTASGESDDHPSDNYSGSVKN